MNKEGQDVNLDELHNSYKGFIRTLKKLPSVDIVGQMFRFVEDLRSEVDSHKICMETLQQEVRAQGEQACYQEELIHSHKEGICSLKKKHGAKRKRLWGQEEEIRALKKRNCDQVEEIGALKKRICDQEEEIRALKKRNCDQVEEIGALKKRNCDQEEEIGALKKRNCNQVEEIGALKKRICDQEEEIRALKKRISHQKEEIRALKKRISHQDDRLNRIEVMLNSLICRDKNISISNYFQKIRVALQKKLIPVIKKKEPFRISWEKISRILGNKDSEKYVAAEGFLSTYNIRVETFLNLMKERFILSKTAYPPLTFEQVKQLRQGDIQLNSLTFEEFRLCITIYERLFETEIIKPFDDEEFIRY